MDVFTKPRINSKLPDSANPAILTPTEKAIACLTAEGGVFLTKNSRTERPNIKVEARLATKYKDSLPVMPKSLQNDSGNRSNDTKR